MQAYELQCFGPLGFGVYYLSSELLPNWCRLALESKINPSPLEFSNYLKYFSLTLFLESFFYLPGLRLLGVSLKRSLTILFLANLCTHPIVFFIFPWFGHYFNASYIQTIMLAEFFAVLIEAVVIYILIRPIQVRQVFLLSSISNFFSWGMGLSVLAVLKNILV